MTFNEPAPPRTLTEAVGRIDWICQPPHTIDQIIGIWSETTTKAPDLPWGASPTELAAHLRAVETMRSSGHADPTASGHAPSSADLGPIDETIWQLCAAARDLDAHASACAGQPLWCPPGKPVTRTEQLRDATTRIHHARSTGLEADGHDCATDPAGDHLHIDRAFVDAAGWLHLKALGIWHASKGETLQPAEQRSMSECSNCSPWRKGTVAGPSKLCDQCRDFRYHHKCKPTEAIVRRWEATGRNSTPPGMILEAQAVGGKKVKAS